MTDINNYFWNGAIHFSILLKSHTATSMNEISSCSISMFEHINQDCLVLINYFWNGAIPFFYPFKEVSIIYYHFYEQKLYLPVFILDGNSEQAAHAWRKIGIFGEEKNLICDWSRSYQIR